MKRTIRKVLALMLALVFLAAAGNTALAEEAAAPALGVDPTQAADPVQAAESVSAAGDMPEDGGIIDAAALNQWAEGFMAEHQLNDSYKDFSIGFCYTGTGDSWYYNADVWMYSASMYKVPVSMLLSEKVASGELTQQSTIQGITVEYAESTALVYSNNDSGHAIVSYLGGTYAGKCSDQTEKYTSLPADYFSSDFIDVSYYTARYMTQVMKTLYDGGEARFPHVIEYLLQAQPGAYFRKSTAVEGNYQVAQKFGAYEEPNGNNNNHCAAIIYTPTPIVVVVMTRNVMDYQNIISLVGEHLASYSLELDQKAEELRQAEEERAAAEAQAAAQAAQEAVGEVQQTEEGAAEPSTTSLDTAAEFPETVDASATVPQQADGTGVPQRKIPKAVIILAAVLVAVIVVALILLLVARKRAAEDEAMDEVEEEASWTEPAAVVKKKSTRRSTEEEAPLSRDNRSRRKTEPSVNTERKRSSEGEYKPRH